MNPPKLFKTGRHCAQLLALVPTLVVLLAGWAVGQSEPTGADDQVAPCAYSARPNAAPSDRPTSRFFNLPVVFPSVPTLG